MCFGRCGSPVENSDKGFELDRALETEQEFQAAKTIANEEK